MHITVDQTHLELLRNEHAPTLFRLVDQHRDYLGNWLAWIAGHTSVEDAVRFIHHSDRLMTDKNGGSFGIWYHGELVGVAGLHYVEWDDLITSVGFWLSPDYQQKGLMSRAVFGLMTLAFDHYGINRFEGHAATDNDRSKALFERLGFQREGELRQAQRLPRGFVDHVVYSVVADEWQSMRDRWPVTIESDR